MFRTLMSASALALIAGAAVAQDDAQTDYTPEGVVESPGMTEEALSPDPSTVATKEDARQFGETEFALADADGDGALTEAEFTAYVTAHLQTSMAADAAPLAEGDIDATAEAESFVAPEEAFAEISNGEETISEDALVEARIASFDEADADGDETLDDSERQQFAALVTGKKGW